MPQRWSELAEQLRSLGGTPEKGMSCEDLKRSIAKYFITPDTLPQIFPMCGYDATMEFSEEGNSFWDKYEREYWAEPKIDEIRMLMFFIGGRVRLQSRGRHKHTQLFHETTDNFPQFQKLYEPRLEDTILDGGIVAGLEPTRKRNLWVNNDLLKAMSVTGSRPETAIEIQEKEGWLRYILWDVIKFKGKWMVDESLESRRSLVVALSESLGLDALPQWRRGLKSKYEYVVRTGGEGLMLKRIGSKYLFKRDRAWLKVKRYEDVVGLVHSKKRNGNGAWKGLVGSINVADKDGNIIGAVGTMTLERRKELSLPDGSLNPEFIGRKVLIRYYKKHRETGNPRHCRLIGWVGEDINPEESIKEEL